MGSNHRHICNTVLVGFAVALGGSHAIAGGFAGYTEPLRLTMGSMPTDVFAADLDGDGHVDLASLSQAGGAIVTMRGAGDGSFQDGAVRSTLSAPSAFILADFNGDHEPDVAVVSGAGNQLALHLNLGDGTFGTATIIDIGAPADGIVTGDFNGDGRVDLFVSHRNALRLTLLTGDGAGSFTVADTFATPYYPWSIRAVDANGDHVDDLGVGLLSGGQYNAIRIMLADGRGGFLHPVDSPVVRQPVDIAFGDFNRDQVPDCATSDRTAGVVTTLTGAGDGSFNTPLYHPFNGQPEEISVVDLNNDGVDDVVAAHNYFMRVTTLMGLGDGTFADPLWQAVPTRAMDITHGDFDEDGFDDIAVSHELLPTINVSVMINRSLPGVAARLLDVRAAMGQIIFGPVQDIARSDDVELRARALPVDTHMTFNQIDLRVTAQTRFENPSALNITVESHINHFSGIEQIGLYNFRTRRFDVIMRHRTGLGDRVNSALGVDPTDHIGPDGMMELSIRQAAAPVELSHQFEAYVDWVEFAVE